MTGLEVFLLGALSGIFIIAVGLAYRATQYQRMLAKVGILLGSMALEASGSGNVLISPETLEEFQHGHNVTSEVLGSGHVLVRAFRAP